VRCKHSDYKTLNILPWANRVCGMGGKEKKGCRKNILGGFRVISLNKKRILLKGVEERRGLSG